MGGETTTILKKGSKKPKIFGVWKNQDWVFDLDGKQSFGRLTKSNRPDLSVSIASVSREHGIFFTEASITTYRNLSQANGTYYNDVLMRGSSNQMLKDGDVLRIHMKNDRERDGDVIMIYSSSYADNTVWRAILLNQDVKSLSIGREGSRQFTDQSVSRRHATFMYTPVGWAIVDHNSKNGVYVNNRRIEDKEFLMPMDVIRIAGYHFIYTGNRLLYQAEASYAGSVPPEHQKAVPAGGYQSGPSPFHPGAPGNGGMQGAPVPAPGVRAGGEPYQRMAPQPPAGRGPLGISQYPGSHHQSSYPGGQGYPGAGIPVQNPYPPSVQAGRPYPQHGAPHPPQQYYPVGPSLNIHIEKREVWQSFRKKTLLENIDIDIRSGSLVLILGGSGAGKTTFIQAVMGYEKAIGKIIYKGQDMYREYRKMQYEIGYVPQADLLRGSDSTYKTLENALDNKLKVDSQSEKERKVMDALRLFGLTEQRNTIVSQLSGGEKKRLSTACEYITGPSLFFLDEPDSGLDAASSEQLMRELREVADEGKIILVISHSPNRVAQYFDQVIVLAKGERDNIGHLAYTGPPQEALRFFGTSDLESIVKKINPVEEGGEGRSDYFIALFEQNRRNGRQV